MPLSLDDIKTEFEALTEEREAIAALKKRAAAAQVIADGQGQGFIGTSNGILTLDATGTAHLQTLLAAYATRLNTEAETRRAALEAKINAYKGA